MRVAVKRFAESCEEAASYNGHRVSDVDIIIPHQANLRIIRAFAERLKVPEDKIESFAEAVNHYPGVTHNYQRDNEFNIWFTFIAPSMERIAENLTDIAKTTGIKEIINLPSTRVYKIKAHFNL